MLFQTLRGAVDLVAEEVGLAIRNFEAGVSAPLDQTETETLARRGYLTDETVDQEQQQAKAVLGMVSRTIRRGCEITFRFSPQLEQTSRAAVELPLIEEMFSSCDSAGIGPPNVAVILDVPCSTVDREIVEQILASARPRDIPISPVLTADGMEAMRPWAQSQNFKVATVGVCKSDMPADPAALTQAILDYFEQQVQIGMRCTIDGMSQDQLKAAAEVVQSVKRRYPFFTAWLHSSELGGTQDPDAVAANGSRMPYISVENQGVLRTLFRFITSPRSINYSPFFQPQPAKLVLDLETQRVSYESPGQEISVEGIDSVRDRIRADFQAESALPSEEMSGGCLRCKYALVCGRNWIEEYGYANATDCADAFERRIRQVLPSLLHNMRGNVRPQAPKAHKADN